MKGPQLPERKRKDNVKSYTHDHAHQGQPCLHDLQQQLSSHPVFQQFVDQPDKLLSVLQNDHILSEAAAGNPEIAALLDPATLKQALAVLQGGGHADQQQQQPPPLPVLQQRALMQLQNYAMQLQQARAAGTSIVQHPQQQQQQLAWSRFHAGAAEPAGAAAAPAPPGIADGKMWAALQQRLGKLQQRSSLLAYGQQSLGSGQVGATLGQQQPQPQQQQQQQQPLQPQSWQQSWQQASALLTHPQHQQQYPEQLRQQPQANSSEQHHEHQQQQQGVPWPQQQQGSAGSLHSSPKTAWAVRVASPDGYGSVMSPLGRVTSPDSMTAQSEVFGSPRANAPLQRRASSSLSHRLLRHSSASPLDLTYLQRSGSQALSIERLQSGDIIVDITPPTRVTQELNWSTDPAAGYVLEAASSGSFGSLPTSNTGAVTPATSVTPAAHAAAGAVAMSGPNSSSNCEIEAEETLVALPLLEAATAAAEGTAAGASNSSGSMGAAADVPVPLSSVCPASAGSSGLFVQPKSHNSSTSPEKGQSGPTQQPGTSSSSPRKAAAIAAANRLASSSTKQHQLQPSRLQISSAASTSSSSSQHKQRKPQLQPALAAAAASSTANNNEPSVMLQQQQQQQQQYYAYAMRNLSANSAATMPAAGTLTGAGGQKAWCEHSSTAATAGHSGAAAAAGLSGSNGLDLNARTYYESVEPSSWRPSSTDVGSNPGDYLELYRRAYCSYADALFPPLWMGFVGGLAAYQLLPLWQLLLVGLLSFWLGLYVMAVRWAGVKSNQLGLSRVTPVFTVCLELVCTGALAWQVLPVMWFGHSIKCAVTLAAAVSALVLHLTAFLQDPGYTPIPDPEEGLYARHLAATSSLHTNTTGPAAATTSTPASTAVAANGHPSASADARSSNSSRLAATRVPADATTSPMADSSAAAEAQHSEVAPLLGGSGQTQQQQQQQDPQQQQQQQYLFRSKGPAPLVDGKPLNSCWSCGVPRNLRAKHCPLCKRCVERFDHHCPVLGNCVGAGNHRTFVAFLAVLVLSQLLFSQLLGGMLVQTYLLQAESTAGQAQSLGVQLVHASRTAAQQLTTQRAAAAAVGAAAGSSSIGSAGGERATSAADDATGSSGVGSTAAGSAPALQRGASALSSGVHAASENSAAAVAEAAMAGTLVGTAANTPVNAPATGHITSSTSSNGIKASGSSRPGMDVTAAAAGWGVQGWWLTLQAIWAAAHTQTVLVLLLLVQVPTLLLSCSLLLRALALAAANLTVNEWINRHRYLYLQHPGAGFCNRFDRGVGHNCFEFWAGPVLVDWWEVWEQAEQELRSKGMTVLLPRSATLLIRFWDVRWSKYQQRLMASRERRREVQMQRRMRVLGLTANDVSNNSSASHGSNS